MTATHTCPLWLSAGHSDLQTHAAGLSTIYHPLLRLHQPRYHPVIHQLSLMHQAQVPAVIHHVQRKSSVLTQYK